MGKNGREQFVPLENNEFETLSDGNLRDKNTGDVYDERLRLLETAPSQAYLRVKKQWPEATGADLAQRVRMEQRRIDKENGIVKKKNISRN